MIEGAGLALGGGLAMVALALPGGIHRIPEGHVGGSDASPSCGGQARMASRPCARGGGRHRPQRAPSCWSQMGASGHTGFR